MEGFKTKYHVWCYNELYEQWRLSGLANGYFNIEDARKEERQLVELNFNTRITKTVVVKGGE